MNARKGIRISAGSLKGQTIEVPTGLRVRPMRSRIREALFTILGESLNGARFLDVFAGSGSIAIEALSRGASEALLVENHPEVLRVLRRNLDDLALGERTRIAVMDIYRSLPTIDSPYDIVFLDPPFPNFKNESLDPWQLAMRLVDSPLLAPGGIIGLEHPSKLDAHPPPNGFSELTSKAYGDTSLVLWQGEAAARE